MKMTKKEYDELILRFEFLIDKSESCYAKELEELLKRYKKEYKKCIM